MQRTAVWAAFIGVLALIVALMWAGPYIRSRHGTGVSAVSNPPVGTAGHEGADEADESPATLHDLETVTGTVDPHELIGQRVDLHVQVADINNDTSFWVGIKDNRMLVVHNAPSPNDIKPATRGQRVRITGTIEGIPNTDARAFEDQKVYIRAEHVTPEG
jgi:hypothetical protein